MFDPYLRARRICRVGELERNGAACLNARKRRAHDLESCGASATAACVPAYVERAVSNREVGIIGTSTFAEKAGHQVPISPRRTIAVLYIGRTSHGETVPGALQNPDEAVDRRRVLDDLVAAEPDGIVRKYRRRIEDLEGAAAVGREGDPPVGRDEDHAIAAGAARLCACRGRVAAASESGSGDPHRTVPVEPDRGRIADRRALGLVPVGVGAPGTSGFVGTGGAPELTSLSIRGGRGGYRPPSTFCEGTWLVPSGPEPSGGGGMTTNVWTLKLRAAPPSPR